MASVYLDKAKTWWPTILFWLLWAVGFSILFSLAVLAIGGFLGFEQAPGAGSTGMWSPTSPVVRVVSADTLWSGTMRAYVEANDIPGALTLIHGLSERDKPEATKALINNVASLARTAPITDLPRGGEILSQPYVPPAQSGTESGSTLGPPEVPPPKINFSPDPLGANRAIERKNFREADRNLRIQQLESIQRYLVNDVSRSEQRAELFSMVAIEFTGLRAEAFAITARRQMADDIKASQVSWPILRNLINWFAPFFNERIGMTVCGLIFLFVAFYKPAFQVQARAFAIRRYGNSGDSCTKRALASIYKSDTE